ncbi:hypothetical protein [Streptomyces cacaoi]|uniref:hypothetical protein n=1 Tax=Streptomyces cacaoi TaxID=1898 RepID=UPI0016596544|nr:hypothetical protein [Streptomyces cacaoi]
MITQPADDRIRSAVADLISTFENLGAEHEALAAEEAKTSAKERRSTVARMVDGIAQTSRTVSASITALATVQGLRALGIVRQRSRDADGRDYTPLTCLADPTETLYDSVTYLGEAADHLERTYAPTKKHPSLAVARCPTQMRVALTSLRTALDAVCAEVGEDDAEVAEDHAEAHTLLTELEVRVCRTTPAQDVGPSADQVVSAILSDPKVARAAAEALAATPNAGRCPPRPSVEPRVGTPAARN